MTIDTVWYELYAAAMLEFDRAALPAKIEAARTAIHQAMEEATANQSVGTPADMQSMSDALRNLQALQRVELSPSRKLPISNCGPGPAPGGGMIL